MEELKKIFDGLKISELNHIKKLSSYNNNYYNYKKFRLLGISKDDEDETEWYLIEPKKDPNKIYLGISYFSDGKNEKIEFGISNN